MNKKVLGFEKKDGILHEWNWLVNKNSLIPVVSVEWLEKFCKKHGTDIWYEISSIQVKELLDAVRLQVKKNE